MGQDPRAAPGRSGRDRDAGSRAGVCREAAAAGSTVAFTYVHRSVLDAPGTFEGAEDLLRELVRLGEPWTFGLDPAETRAYLRARGLTLVEDLGADEYRARYLAGRPDGRRGYAFYRVALATVADRTAAG